MYKEWHRALGLSLMTGPQCKSSDSAAQNGEIGNWEWAKVWTEWRVSTVRATHILINCSDTSNCGGWFLNRFSFIRTATTTTTTNYSIVRTVNDHKKYGMVLQMYLTIHKYNIATNVIYSNNNYMFRPRGAIIRLCNRILNRLCIAYLRSYYTTWWCSCCCILHL
jgi:hypothetical protein